MSISRDEEGVWMVETGTTHLRSGFAGAKDVDVVLSPFFNTLPIRRFGLQHESEDIQVPVVYVNLPDLAVQEASLTYSSGADGIHVLAGVVVVHQGRRGRFRARLPGAGRADLTGHPAAAQSLSVGITHGFPGSHMCSLPRACVNPAKGV